ncbi:hypothetical protein C0J52_13696 [Blattella germanica]|nr:hypothetical protein C0J52_13696 [Blattella germanica]
MDNRDKTDKIQKKTPSSQLEVDKFGKQDTASKQAKPSPSKIKPKSELKAVKDGTPESSKQVTLDDSGTVNTNVTVTSLKERTGNEEQSVTEVADPSLDHYNPPESDTSSQPSVINVKKQVSKKKKKHKN